MISAGHMSDAGAAPLSSTMIWRFEAPFRSLARAGTRSMIMAAACLWFLPAASLAGQAAARQGRPFRKLAREELLAAREARDRADRLRAEYERRYLRPDAIPPGEAKAFHEALGAYKQALALCEHTSLEPYVRFRLAGLYACRQDRANEIAQVEEVARRFRGTEHEMEAYHSFGLMYLHQDHDPAKALVWFSKLRVMGRQDRKDAVALNRLARTQQLYWNAQRQSARCEILLGRKDAARKRYDELIARHPERRARLERDFEQVVRYTPVPRHRGGPSAKRSARIRPDALLRSPLTARTPVETLIPHGGERQEAKPVPQAKPIPHKAVPSVGAHATRPVEQSGRAPQTSGATARPGRPWPVIPILTIVLATTGLALFLVRLGRRRKETKR